MRISIQTEDNIIVIDRVAKTVDCERLREAQISAVQWYGDHGEIEYERHARPNETFDNLDQFQSLVDGAAPLTDPKMPTPDELHTVNAAYHERNPDARRAWEARDKEIMARLAQTAEEQRQQLLRQGEQALLTRNQPAAITDQTNPQPEKAKPKPKKR
jgi:hypothetical protein